MELKVKQKKKPTTVLRINFSLIKYSYHFVFCHVFLNSTKFLRANILGTESVINLSVKKKAFSPGGIYILSIHLSQYWDTHNYFHRLASICYRDSQVFFLLKWYWRNKIHNYFQSFILTLSSSVRGNYNLINTGCL